MDYDEAIKELSLGKPYVIRLKSPGSADRKTMCHDLIKGDIEMPENDQDIVILKSDGLPTYHFAHAVDDHLMHTTHVVRGEEWLPSLPVHLQLFEVLGFTAPKYAHIPTLMKMDGNSKRKLSKRKDPEISIEFYRQLGYTPAAVIEYLLNLINSSYENWRRDNPEKPCEDFKIEIDKISQSGALFDIEKLNNISRDMIAKMDAETVFNLYYDWLVQYDSEFAHVTSLNKEYTMKILNIERNVEKPRKDFAKWSDLKDNIVYFFDDFFESNMSDNSNYPDNMNILDVSEILEKYLSIYNHYDDKNTWFGKIKTLSAELGYARDYKTYKKDPVNYKSNIADVACVLRVAVTSKKNTPDLYEIMQVMGKERVLKRLSRSI
jgi:glutamyl-tRNA synthetase